jgi:hypothetical protein
MIFWALVGFYAALAFILIYPLLAPGWAFVLLTVLGVLGQRWTLPRPEPKIAPRSSRMVASSSAATRPRRSANPGSPSSLILLQMARPPANMHWIATSCS